MRLWHRKTMQVQMQKFCFDICIKVRWTNEAWFSREVQKQTEKDIMYLYCKIRKQRQLIKDSRYRCHLESHSMKLLRHDDSVKDMEWSDLIQSDDVTSDDKTEGKKSQLCMSTHLHIN